LIGVNDLNKKANGGTEQVTRRLFDLLDPEELDGIQIITSRVRELDPDAIKIYHLHDLPLDPEMAHLRDASSRDRFDKLVFNSHWQYQQAQNQLGIPYNNHSCVIENGVDPIGWVEKPDPRTNPIKLIYTPTPHRGLEILVPVFEHLATIFDFIELDVFSSFELYGWPERDEPFTPLFDRCKAHPRIRYHGTVADPTILRKAYQDAHIFAYPSIWPETSCRCLIEAMMAGCLCIHPNFAALPETSCGLTDIYDGDSDLNAHANRFAGQLIQIINAIRTTDVWENPGLRSRRITTHTAANIRFGWPSIIEKWKALIAELKANV
jgi:glycosyltransferase involved in cell wall biosynthesis